MKEIYTSKFENLLVKLLGGTLRRILYNKSEIYYGTPCILNVEDQLILEVKIEDKYYELIFKKIVNVNAHDNIRLERFWTGIFNYRLISNRNYLNSFTLLESPHYSCNYNLMISLIEVYISNYSEDMAYFGYILIYLKPDKVLQIRRHPEEKYIELIILDSKNYSNSSFEDDFNLYKSISINNRL